VVVVERTNIRYADPEQLGAPFDLVVADLSFISLHTVVEVLIRLGSATTEYLLLIKPQFEAGPEGVGKGGIVRDDEIRVETVQKTVDALEDYGLGAVDLTPSPITGTKGNREVVGRFRHGPATVDAAQVREVST
jgi:23S rRNA (cytidine1920-2'-O)/16S rRNA (cytidine1409-2'-O)-methyltransferase